MLFDSSIRKEMSRNFGATLVILLTVVLTMLLIRMLGLAAKGSVAASDVTLLLGYTVIAQLPMLLNLSLFIAVVSALSRMYRQSEMVVWFSSGAKLWDWLQPILRMSWPIFLAMLFVVALVRPWAQSQTAELKDRYERRSDLSRVAPGQFQTSRSGNRVFFIDRDAPSSEEGHNVFILTRDSKEESITTAQAGHIVFDKDQRWLVLNHGQRVIFNQKNNEKLVSRFDVARLSTGDQEPGAMLRKPLPSRSTLDLLAHLDAPALGELSWRVGQVWMTFNLLLIGVALAAGNPRRGSSWYLIFALLTFLAYFNILNLSQAWVGSGKFAFGPTLLLLHGAILLTACGLIWWRNGAYTRWPFWRRQ